jgi:hypothetical protein
MKDRNMTTAGSPRAQRRRMMPDTLPGRWSVVAFGVFILGAMALFLAAASGQTGGDTILDNLWLGIPGIIAIAAATTSMITGLIAVLARGERFASVLVSVTVSTLVVLYVALELILG